MLSKSIHFLCNAYFHYMWFHTFLAMFEKCVYLMTLLMIFLERIVALQPSSKNNYVLPGYVFKRFHTKDWLFCIRACHNETGCISYNYDRSSGGNGLCELNECGLEVTCDDNGSLKFLIGFLFQQIREGKVSKISKSFWLWMIVSDF